MPDQTTVDVDLECAKVDRAVVLGLMSEMVANTLKWIVLHGRKRAVDLAMEGDPPRTKAVDEERNRLCAILEEDPYVR